jgi:heme exporter protein B
VSATLAPPPAPRPPAPGRGGLRGYLGDVAALAAKDIRLELRSRDTLPAMALFVLSTMTIFHFALPAGAADAAAEGMLWVAILFTALLGLTRTYAPEREQGMFDGLLLSPVDRSAIWLAKTIAAMAFLFMVEVVALLAFWLFFDQVTGATLAAVVLANIGLCAVGALVAAMATASRSRELLLPLLLLPLTIPVIVGAVGASVGDDPGKYLAFLAMYDAIFGIIAWATFEYVVAESP